MDTYRDQETSQPLPPIDECVACGAEFPYDRAMARTEKDFRGETFVVEHHHWKCRECGVAVLGDGEMDEAVLAVWASHQEIP